MYDPDSHEEEVSAATLRVRSKITKSARGGYAVEQTIELACPIVIWGWDRSTKEPIPYVTIGYSDAGEEIKKPYKTLYQAALEMSGTSLMDEVKRRQQADGGLRITEDSE